MGKKRYPLDTRPQQLGRHRVHVHNQATQYLSSPQKLILAKVPPGGFKVVIILIETKIQLISWKLVNFYA